MGIFQDVICRVASYANLREHLAKEEEQVRKKKRSSRRGYDAGKTSDLFADFLGAYGSADRELTTLAKIRARSRDMAMNNPYAKHALKIIKDNVVGYNGGFGIKLSMKVKNRGAKASLDSLANRIIQNEWRRWGKKGNCTADGKLSWLACQHLFITTVARDGEVLVRKINAKNSFGFAIEFIEGDHLEETHNHNLANGNRIRMGVEFDKWHKPVAYHVLTQHPGDNYSGQYNQQKRERVPASQIIHAFLTERPGQSRGVPWSHATVTRFKMLGGFEEATVVGARIGASQMGFFTKEQEIEGYEGDEIEEDGQIIDEVSPGTLRELPVGMKFEKFDPDQPKTNFADFVKSMLRSVGAALGIGYNTLAGDLENVNYSSLRAGSLQERDGWQVLQGWMIENFHQEIFSGGKINWLRSAFLTGRLDPLSFSDFDRYDDATWRPRGWKWVDPSKDVKAKKEELGCQLTSRTRICAEQGIEFEELLDEIATENELAEAKGVVLGNPESKEPQTIEAEDEKKDEV